LIAPEVAHELGIKAEGPVFVSPVIREGHMCEECNEEFTPLIYQVGYIVESQHFHESNNGGGIYGCEYIETVRYDYIRNNGGFMGVLEAMGEPIKDSVTFSGGEWGASITRHLVRAQKTLVTGIRAFTGQTSLPYDEINEGYLVGISEKFSSEKFLFPRTRRQIGNNINAIRYSFKILESGEIFFGPPDIQEERQE